MKLKGKKLKDEKMKHLQSHGEKSRVNGIVWDLGEGKKKKKKKCIGLAKMFVWVLHVAILSIAYYKKPKQTLANPIVTKTI